MRVLCIGGKCDGQWIDVEMGQLTRGWKIDVATPIETPDAGRGLDWDTYIPTDFHCGHFRQTQWALRHYTMDAADVMQRLLAGYVSNHMADGFGSAEIKGGKP